MLSPVKSPTKLVAAEVLHEILALMKNKPAASLQDFMNSNAIRYKDVVFEQLDRASILHMAVVLNRKDITKLLIQEGVDLTPIDQVS